MLLANVQIAERSKCLCSVTSVEDICSVDSLCCDFLRVFTVRYSAYRLNVVPFLEKLALVASEDTRLRR